MSKLLKKIGKIIKKNWAIIGFLISFILDSQYGILEHFIQDVFWINIIKGLGVFITAYFTQAKLGLGGNANHLNKDEDPEDIGGGGIKNPPKS